MAEEKALFRIAQLSDVHFGSSRHDPALMDRVLAETNDACPDLVVIPGDLTSDGHPDEFLEAKRWIERIECPNVVVLLGNHDARDVGSEIFKEVFGDRYFTRHFPFGVSDGAGVQQHVTVVGVDSSEPDLDDGQLGRHRHRWLTEQLSAAQDDFKLVALHHHLIGIPGTGRERNVVTDAGDVLEILAEQEVDLVLAGHKHVPYVWPLASMLVVTSGTAGTWRTRGYSPPSYNMIEITSEHIGIEIRSLATDEKRHSRWRRLEREKSRPPGSGPRADTVREVAPGSKGG